MSRLIRDPENNNLDSVPDLVLNDAVVLKLLKACQTLAVEQAQTAFQKFLKQLDVAFNAEIDRAASNQERAQLVQLQKQIRQNRVELERYFCGYVAESYVKFRKKQLNTTIAQDIGTETELALLDNERLEESIAIASISQRVNVYYSEPLWALNRRMSVINGGDKVAEESNPAAPIQLCESLRRALKLLQQIDARGKAIVYRVYDEQMFDLAGNLILETNQYLKTQGILPHLRYTIPSTSSNLKGSAAGSTAIDQAQPETQLPGDAIDLPSQDDIFHAIQNLQTLLAAEEGSGRLNAGRAGAVAAGADQVLNALAAIQNAAAGATAVPDTGLAPADIRAVVQALADQLSDGNGGQLNRNEMQTIDLVGMLFEYMLNDENLPDAIKALLSYLHTPFLKLAFVDPGFFEKSQHPARLLLNNLAEAGARWVRDDGSSEFGIYNKIKDIVDRVLRDFDNDVRVIAELLFEFSSFTKDIVRRQELMERRAKEKAQGEEKLRSVKLRVNDVVRERTDGRELPSAVLLLLLQPWSDYLSFVLLRFGEDADAWHESLAVIDDILWCIEPKQSPSERARQQELHLSILQALEAGLETIGYDQGKARQLIDAVDSLIKQVMQRKKVEPAPAPVRTELERLAAEKAGSLTSGKAERLTPEEERIVDNLKMVEFGTWFEFAGGQRLKVAWYNNRTSHYMLVDQMGKRAAMMSGLDIARSMIAGTARIISGSSKPFFDRALENIFQKLNAQAEALHIEEEQP